MLLFQMQQQRPQDVDFTDAHGVEPDASARTSPLRHTAHELGSQALSVLPFADSCVEQPRRAQDEQQQVDDIQ